MGLKDLLNLGDSAVEFECNDCGYEFSKVVKPEETPTCPECDSFDIERD